MKIMVGIDLHSNNALCGLMDESGRRLVHKKLPCDLAAILQLLEAYKESVATVAIESTFNSTGIGWWTASRTTAITSRSPTPPARNPTAE